VVHNYAAFEDLRGVVRNPVRIDGGKGGPIESEAYRISFKRDIVMAARLSDDLLEERHRTTDAHRLRWKPHLTVGDGEDVDHLGEYPVRFTDVDLFDHMNNAAHWSVVEDYLSTHPEPLRAPLQVTPLEYEAPNPLGDKVRDPRAHPPGRFHRQVRRRTRRTALGRAHRSSTRHRTDRGWRRKSSRAASSR
jgi:Acyl-ACP thioesterase